MRIINYEIIKDSLVGTLYLIEEQGFLTRISLTEPTESEAILGETKLLQETKTQLSEYFEGTRKQFELPLKMEGTEFQKKVWEALLTIPYGATCTYKEIAQKLGKTTASRAVGGANHHNPIMIVVPCHRVIGSNGGLVGYAGGLSVKERLLQVEGSIPYKEETRETRKKL